MSELKIKYVFKGPAEALKKPEIINNTLCIYLNQGSAFLFARNNKSLFELFLNSYNSKNKYKVIELLGNPKFYAFIKEIPNINNYSKILDHNKLENFKSTEKIETNFKKWVASEKLSRNIAIAETGKITRNDILQNYFNILTQKYNIKKEPTVISPKKLKKRKAIKISVPKAKAK